MVQTLDIGFLQNFSHIFTFLLIFTIVFGGMRVIKIFEDRISLQAVVAFLLALLSIMSSLIVKTITLAAPWFVVLFVFSILTLVAFRTFGYHEKELKSSKYGNQAGLFFLAICIIIVLGSFFSVLSEEKGGVPGPGMTQVKTVEGSYIAPKLGPGEEITTLEKLDVVKEELTTQNGQVGAFWDTLFNPKVLGLAMLLFIGFVAVLKLTSETE